MAKIFASGEDDGLYGVEGDSGGVIYDAGFTEETAARVAQLESSPKPPRDWEETRGILEREGLPTSFDASRPRSVGATELSVVAVTCNAPLANEVEMPKRIQRSREKGWKMPPNTVYVGRPTKWGNPFVPGKPALCGPTKGAIVADRRHAFVLYRSLAPQNEKLIAEARAELAGKNLACWCSKDDPYEDACHAAVLLELANAELSRRQPAKRDGGRT